MLYLNIISKHLHIKLKWSSRCLKNRTVCTLMAALLSNKPGYYIHSCLERPIIAYHDLSPGGLHKHNQNNAVMFSIGALPYIQACCLLISWKLLSTLANWNLIRIICCMWCIKGKRFKKHTSHIDFMLLNVAFHVACRLVTNLFQSRHWGSKCSTV